eukprot:TRINITY_DN14980_c0_g5_i1.p1 TRINITY_DN14980_c0_g5~~TRINITY_DN14980_c0_g5_i1.p1  ORF type:complete len:108 (+),score=5.02 TRINITY_DN14980_c0_g5_i1:60-383(+)
MKRRRRKCQAGARANGYWSERPSVSSFATCAGRSSRQQQRSSRGKAEVEGPIAVAPSDGRGVAETLVTTERVAGSRTCRHRRANLKSCSAVRLRYNVRPVAWQLEKQ